MQKVEFGDEYFSDRNLNDLKRMKSFVLEARFMNKYANNAGTVCDIGCSTGEFLKFIEWQGEKFGIEVNSFAAKEAEKASIQIIEKLQDTINIFDVIILRGTIQHLPSPFETIKTAFDKLRPGGVLFLIATPNADSIYFRIFGDLPAFDFPRNYWLPGFKQLKLVCEREGFILSGVQYPYLKSGYASRWDFIKFIARIFLRTSRLECAFPRNMMNLAFAKPVSKENT
jgi:SAM-dependent methyltransferase